MALTVDGTRDVLVADLPLDGPSLVLALLATMKCFLCNDKESLLLTTCTRAAALTKVAPMSLTIHRARCFTAGFGSYGPV